MSQMPLLPSTPDALHAEAPLTLRYEDVCQDGRLMTIAIPHGLGAIWMSSLRALPIATLRRQGIVPILSHMWIEASDEPMHLTKPVRSSGSAALAHTVNEAGEVDRLLLDMQIEITGTRGRMTGTPPPDAGEEVLVGRAYARHVFTRPFAARGLRKVLRFEIDGLPELPAAQTAWTGSEGMRQPPREAKALDDAPAPDTARIAFGLQHCDSNQHVNSLVYPRLFEDAAQRRFADRALDTRTLSRQVAIAFRKPFFAGDQAVVELQAYQDSENSQGAVGSFYAAGDQSGRAHCHVNMRFR